MSDIEIARAAAIKPIGEIADKLSIPNDALMPFGHTKAKVSLDYTNRTRPVLTMRSEVGLTLRKDRTLTFEGELERDFKRRTLEGKVGLKLEFPGDTRVSLTQTFDEDEKVTAINVTARF